MYVKCFSCNAVFKSDDLDSLIDAVVAMGSRRTPGPTPRPSAITCRTTLRRPCGSPGAPNDGRDRTRHDHPVTDWRIDDWLRFFDHDAFAGNPDWASCCTSGPHRRRPGDPNVRGARSGQLWSSDSGLARPSGYLACVDDRPAG